VSFTRADNHPPQINSNHASIIVVLFAIALYVVRNITWAALTADPSLHNDSKEYFKGYQVILQNGFDLSGVENFFGKFPEVLFPAIYYISSFIFTIQDEETLTVFHTAIFTVVYILALLKIFYERKGFLLYKSRYGYASKYWLIIFTSVCPPGVAMQTSRQAVAFAVTIYVISSIHVRWKAYHPIIGAAVTTLMHVGSALNTIFISLICSNRVRIFYLLCLLVAGYAVASIDLVNYLLNLSYEEFKYQESSSFTYPMIINAVIFVFLFGARRTRIGNLSFISIIIIITLLLVDYQFFLRRVFFGFDFFVIPFVLLSLSLNTSQYFVRSSQLRLRSLALVSLFLSNSAPVYYLFYIRQTL